MAITTWLADYERENLTSVTDKELNSLFQEVRSIIPDKYFVSEQTYVTRLWFKTKKVTAYTLYISISKIDDDVQVMSFCGDGESSIHTSVKKSTLYNFFLGVIAGQKIFEQHVG